VATFAYPARVDFDTKLRGQRQAAFLQVISTLASGFFLLFSSRCTGTWSTSSSRPGAPGRLTPGGRSNRASPPPHRQRTPGIRGLRGNLP